jgi:hypothetical protein
MPDPGRRDTDPACPARAQETLAAGTLPLDSSAHPSHAASAWPCIDGFEVLDELGRGGMGVVYKAWQVPLQRLVALKMIVTGNTASQAHLDRFRAETLAVARVQHPNIIQLFDVGVHDGKPYFFMEYAAGGSLARKLDAAPQPFAAAAQLVQTLARAVHVAHEHGIVHRDLKPANVLLTDDGVLKITDFGLAKRLDDESAQTQTGSILGTPSYMAPEQAEGRVRDVAPATDVYALGAILYELLTGRAPFRGASMLETLDQVRAVEPVPPRFLRPGTPRDLETICLTCLQKDTACRYPSAAALADDLERFISGEPIAMRPAGLLGRLSRTLGRNRLRAEFQAWGNLLIAFGAIVCAFHVVLDQLYRSRQPLGWIVAIDCGQMLLLGLALWLTRIRRPLPVQPEEHRLWLEVIAFLMACALVRFIVARQAGGVDALYEMREYPLFAVLSGLVLFIMGSAHWGRCYLFALLFAVAALLLPYYPAAGVLTFGALWTVSLCSLGLHLRRLSPE